MALVLTPTQLLLIDLLISNAIRAAIETAINMTPEQVAEATKVEEARKIELTKRLDAQIGGGE